MAIKEWLSFVFFFKGILVSISLLEQNKRNINRLNLSRSSKGRKQYVRDGQSNERELTANLCCVFFLFFYGPTMNVQLQNDISD